MGPTVVTPRTHTRFRERQQAVERLEAVEAVRMHEANPNPNPTPTPTPTLTLTLTPAPTLTLTRT